MNEFVSEFEMDNNEKSKIEDIEDSAVYAKALEAGYLLGIYYLVF